MATIDLNAKRQQRAAKREGGGKDIPVLFGDPEQTFMLPAELPLTVLDRLLSPEVEIGRLVAMAVSSFQAGQKDAGDVIFDVLAKSPNLPANVVAGVLGAVEDVFNALDAEQWGRFMALNPSLNDLFALVADMVSTYGASLGEAFASSISSASDGATSSAISNGSTASMPVVSGPTLVTPASSAAGG